MSRMGGTFCSRWTERPCWCWWLGICLSSETQGSCERGGEEGEIGRLVCVGSVSEHMRFYCFCDFGDQFWFALEWGD